MNLRTGEEIDMSAPIFWNRRSGIDRRLGDSQCLGERRLSDDRRSFDSDRYVLVVGSKGLDAFTVSMFIPVSALLMVAVIAIKL